MAYEAFKPEVLSKQLMVDRERDCVFRQLCYKGPMLGNISMAGDVIRIAGIVRPTVRTLTNGSGLTRQNMTANLQSLYIDQQKYIDVEIFRTDNKQAQGDIVKATVAQGKEALARDIDESIAGLYGSAANTVTEADLKSSNIISTISLAEQYLLEADVPLDEQKYLVVSPAIYQVMQKARIVYDTTNSQFIGKGYKGAFMGFDIFVSNSIQASSTTDYCMAFTNRSIALAEQIMPGSTEFYRPHDEFSDAFKTLNLYGRKVIVPGELVCLTLTPTTDPDVV